MGGRGIRRAVAHLLRGPPAPGVMLVLALRTTAAPGELLVALTAAAREGVLVDLELAALTSAEAQALIGDLDVRERIYRDSGGNPFYLEELAHTQRTATRANDGEAGRGVPLSVRVAIEQEELANLSEDARLVLRAAAVVGDPFDPAIAAAVAEVTEGVALGALDEAAALDLVQPTALPRRLRFRHPIVRWSVYDGCGPAWRIGAQPAPARRLPNAALHRRGVPGTSSAPRCAVTRARSNC